VRRGGDDFVDTARALCGTVAAVLERQSSNHWKWVSVKLNENSGNEIKSTQESHKEERELWQLAQLGRQPFEWIFADLESTH
jgi:hypothetical protein